jgi:putative oxidoreductase
MYPFNFANRVFGRLEARLGGWLAQHSVALLRLSMGLVFLGFGVLKFVPDLSPAEDLSVRTVGALTFGMLSGDPGRLFVATLESLIGISLLSGRWLRLGLALLGMAMVGILSPLVLFPADLFTLHSPMLLVGPTLEGQYVMKDVVLLSSGLVVAGGVLRRQRRQAPPPPEPHS